MGANEEHLSLNFSLTDAFNTINLKLFPSYPNPPAVHDYQVPVTTMDVKNMMTSNWDITVQKVKLSIFLRAPDKR